MRRAVLAAAAAAALAVPGEAAAWDFRTPGDAAYCRIEQGTGSAFLCMTPNDGFWIRLSRLNGRADVAKGQAPRFRTKPAGVRLLPFGRTWMSSDAAVVTCWSRRSGLTCRHYDGLSFWLGRFRGYRIYYDAPGFRPQVRPLFRTPFAWCGSSATFEGALLRCWSPLSGLELTLTSSDAAEHGRRERAKGYRPRGFRLLARGRTFAWQRISCRYDATRLTCRNARGRGFWMTARSFYAF